MFNGTFIALALWTVLSAAGDNHEGEFVVHEWGTFTSFSGSDGVLLEYRPTIGADLPDFVLDRPKWFDKQADSQAGTKQSIPAQQRMETPVIYFYSDCERDVRVRVGFPKGLLTEFYPPPDAVGPPHEFGRRVKVADGLLEWSRLRIVPAGSTQKSPPEPESGEPSDRYYHARETEAALVRTLFSGREHFEKFLFYRGVGNFKLPVQLRAVDEGRIEFTASAGDPIASAFVVKVGSDAGFRFAEYSALNGKSELRVPQERSEVRELATAMTAVLVRAGLYEREAKAMVKTWQDEWFEEPGTRVLYVVPRCVTDHVLPLDLEPKPDKLVRILVGRMDILTPEQEERIEQVIRQISTGPGSDDASNILGELGRFAEPALRHVAEITDDPRIRDVANELLRSVRSAD